MYTCIRFFDLKWLSQTIPPWLLINILEYFFYFGFKFTDILLLHILGFLSKRTELFAYSQYMNQLHIPHILSIQTNHSAYSTDTHSKIPLEDLPQSAYSLYMYRFILFSVNEQIHPAYSHYMYRFIPPILKCT
jgi:hypothetical protein